MLIFGLFDNSKYFRINEWNTWTLSLWDCCYCALDIRTRTCDRKSTCDRKLSESKMDGDEKDMLAALLGVLTVCAVFLLFIFFALFGQGILLWRINKQLWSYWGIPSILLGFWHVLVGLWSCSLLKQQINYCTVLFPQTCMLWKLIRLS